MRSIPSNIMAGFLGLGYDADHSEVYNTTALDYKCIGYWRFGEPSAYSGINGEVINSAPFGVNGVMSTVGATHSTANGNMEFDGVTGFVDFGNYYNFSYDEPLSLSAWVDNRGVNTENSIIGKGSETTSVLTSRPLKGWTLQYTTANRYRYFNAAANSSDVLKHFSMESVSTYSTGVTRHVVITDNGDKSTSGSKMYINGSTIAVNFFSVSNASVGDDASINSVPMQMGARNSTELMGNIILDEVAIWNRELSSSNVSALYNGGAGTTIKFINHVPDVAYMVNMIEMELGSGTRYFTDSDIDIVFNDGTGNQKYLSRGLTVPNIEYSASPTVDQVSIEFDNVDFEFSKMVLGEEVRGKTVKIYLANLNKVPQVMSRSLMFLGIIDTIHVDRNKATINLLSHMYLWQKQIPKRRHSSRCQWTFKDPLTCKYAGSDTVCDKSWDDCDSSNRNNTANFGGFRWLPSLIDRQIWWGRSKS